MQIAIVNSTDFGGGAESVARMLQSGLQDRGHDAVLWVGRRRGEDTKRTRQLPYTGSERRVALRYLHKGFFNLGLPASLRFCDSTLPAGTDLVHLHNLHGHYFSITALPRLAACFPLVWTFHDFFPITGGCAFPEECERWMSRCGQCPQLGRYPLATEYDRTRRMQSIKRRAFRDLPVTIVTPSEHLARAVRRSGVFASADIHTIPYGVDTKVFRPDRQRARQQLGLSGKGPVVLLAAQGLDDPRKGMAHAVTALRQVDVPGLVVLLTGRGDAQPIIHAMSTHDVRPLGYIMDRSELARCYAAADLVIFTSLAENFPCVVQEAMASGTAVLAFDIDGIREQITPDRTGFIVPAGDTESLSRVAGDLLHNVATLPAIGAAARRHAETQWNLDRFIDRHERLYYDIRLSAISSQGSARR